MIGDRAETPDDFLDSLKTAAWFPNHRQQGSLKVSSEGRSGPRHLGDAASEDAEQEVV